MERIEGSTDASRLAELVLEYEALQYVDGTRDHAGMNRRVEVKREMLALAGRIAGRDGAV